MLLPEVAAAAAELVPPSRSAMLLAGALLLPCRVLLFHVENRLVFLRTGR